MNQWQTQFFFETWCTIITNYCTLLCLRYKQLQEEFERMHVTLWNWKSNSKVKNYFLAFSSIIHSLWKLPLYRWQVVANLSKIYPKDVDAPAGGVDDMTKLSYLHEPGVLQNLSDRFQLNEIYVRRSLSSVHLLNLLFLTFARKKMNCYGYGLWLL